MSKRNWIEEEDKYIIENANKMTWKDMASFLHCSTATVQNRALKLGIDYEHQQVDRWTDEEVSLLKEYSKKYVTKTIAKKLNKSVKAIKSKALKENVKLKHKKDKWKPWMVHYVEDNINKQSIRQIALFLNVNDYQVKMKCKELRLTYDNYRWTKEEEQILIDNASKCHYSELTKLLPGKSKRAIISKARLLNIKLITEKIEYDQDVAKYIIDNWGKKSINELSRVLKLPKSRIYNYKDKLNLPNIGQRKKWTEDNINKLDKLSKNLTIDELAKEFKTTNSSITTIASKYNIKLINRKSKITDDIEIKINELAPNHTLNEMSVILDIPTNAIRLYCKKNNIIVKKDSNRSWTNEEINILKELINKGYPIFKIMEYINKSDLVIISKCKELNLDYINFTRKKWTSNEEDKLVMDAKELNINELVIKYQSSSQSIRRILKKHNVKAINLLDYWTDEEEIRLRKLFEEHKSVSEIAKELNRTNTAIEVKLNKEKMHFSNKKYWTDEEIEYLKENWDEHTVTYLSKKMNRTISSIKNKAYNIGLKKQFLHPEGITIADIAELFNVRRNEIETTWMILGLPYKVQRITNVSSYKYVEIEDLFKFLEQNQFLYDGKDFEENILGVEPEWVKQKRKHDYFIGFNENRTSLIKKKLLQQKKYYLEELKEQNQTLIRKKDFK